MAHKILWNTTKFIEERRAKKYANEGYFFILGGAFIFSLTLLLMAYKLMISKVATFSGKDLTIMSLSAFATTYLFALVTAYFLKELVDVVYAKFNYERAVAVIGYVFFLITTGFAIAVLLALIPGEISLILMIPIIPLFVIKAYGLFIKALSMYAKMDMVESFVISFVLTTAIIVGIALSEYIYIIMHFKLNALIS